MTRTKRIAVITLALLMLATAIAFAVPNKAAVNYTIQVNGVNLSKTYYPTLTVGKVINVPAKIVAMKLTNMGYTYSGGNITIKYDGNTYKMSTKNTNVYKNNKLTNYLSVNPRLSGGMVYLPIDFYSDVLKITGTVSSSSAIVSIRDKKTTTTTPTSPPVVSSGNFTVAVNTTSLTSVGYVKSGVRMFPLQQVANALGASYGYNSSSRTATVTYNGKSSAAQAGNYYMNNSGTSVTMSVTPEEKNGVFYVASTFIERAFNATITASGSSVKITATKTVTTSTNITKVYPLIIDNLTVAKGVVVDPSSGKYMADLSTIASKMGYTVSINGSTVTLNRYATSYNVNAASKIVFTIGTNRYTVTYPYKNNTDGAGPTAAKYLTVLGTTALYIPVDIAETIMGGYVTGGASAGSIRLTTSGTGSSSGTGYGLYINGSLQARRILTDPTTGQPMIELYTAANALGYSVTQGTSITLYSMYPSGTNAYYRIALTLNSTSAAVQYTSTMAQNYITLNAAPKTMTEGGFTGYYIPLSLVNTCMGGYSYVSGSYYYITTQNVSSVNASMDVIINNTGATWSKAAAQMGTRYYVSAYALAAASGYTYNASAGTLTKGSVTITFTSNSATYKVDNAGTITNKTYVAPVYYSGTAFLPVELTADLGLTYGFGIGYGSIRLY